MAVWLVVVALASAQGPSIMVHPPRSLPTLAPLQPVPSVRLMAYQKAGEAGKDGGDAYDIQLAPPGLERLSRLESDEKLFERIRQERLVTNPNDPVTFPESPILSREQYVGRGNLWQRRQLTVEPNFLYYGKMQAMFEDTNLERYGWDLGPASVPVAYTKFFSDVVLLPMKTFANPCRIHECSAGHCLPGDPVPFLLYPVEFNIPGVSAEVATIIALVVMFP